MATVKSELQPRALSSKFEALEETPEAFNLGSPGETGQPINLTVAARIRRLFNFLLRVWIEQDRLRSLSVVALCLWLFATAAVMAWIGPLPQAQFGHDSGGLLDGAWRVWSGQIPHVDFFTSLGPLTYMVFTAGLVWGNLSPAGIGPVMALCGLVLGTWAYVIARTRLVPLLAAFFAAFVALLGTAPYALGFQPWLPTYAMFYNRLSYSLLAIIVVEGFAHPFVKQQTRAQCLIGGFSSGIAIGILFFLKISYFGIGLGILAASFAVAIRNRERFAGIAAGAAVVFLPMFAYLRFDVGAVLSDLAATAKGRSSGVLVRQFRLLFDAEIPSVLAITALLAAELSHSSERSRAAVRCLIMTVVILGADLAVCATNQQAPCFPMTAVVALLLVNEATLYARQLGAPALRSSALLLSAVIGWGIIHSASYFANDTAGLMIAAGMAAERGHLEDATAIDAPHLRSLLFLPEDSALRLANGRFYTNRVNDGLALIKKHSGSRDSVVVLGFTNPFSYALLRPPARGGSPFWGMNNNYSDQSIPDSGKLIGNAAVVMIPKDTGLYRESAAPLLEQECKPVLDKNFRLAGETNIWRMYVRTSTSRGISTQ
jgi:hypothetical protein